MTRNDGISAGVGAVIVCVVVYFVLQSQGGDGLMRTAGEPSEPPAIEAPEDVSEALVAPLEVTESAAVEEAQNEDVQETPLKTTEEPSQSEGTLAAGATDGAGETDAGAAPEALDQVADEAPSPEQMTQSAEEADAAGAASEDAAPETPSAPPGDEPSFDVVRIEPDGSGLVAGRAKPGAEVDVVVDGEVIAQTKADEDGAFVAFVTIDRKTGETGDGEAATAPEAEAEAAPDASAGEDEKAEESAEPSAQTLVIRARPDEDGPVAESAPVFVIGGLTEDAAPVVVQPEAETVRVIQPPKRAAASAVTLDAISYDASGRVVFAGRGRPEGAVRLYLNGAPIAETPLSDDGSWRTRAAAPIAAGVYRLRVDQIGASGAVLSRIETPFQREDIAQGPLGDGVVTVQRGDSLWRLAETAYGAGLRYTVIYAANDDQIRDPDLIYPGQIFTVPETARP